MPLLVNVVPCVFKKAWYHRICETKVPKSGKDTVPRYLPARVSESNLSRPRFHTLHDRGKMMTANQVPYREQISSYHLRYHFYWYYSGLWQK